MRGSEFYAYLFHHVRLGQHSSVSNTICIYTDQGRLERWNTRTQQRLWHQVSARPHQVLALSDGCVVRFKQHTRYYDGLQGQPRQLSDTARAISQQDNSVFVISDKQIEQFNASGKRIRTIPGQLGLQQLLIVAHNTVLAGYNDGQIAILNHNAHTRNHTFEILSNAAVVAMIVGPPNTVIAGHANGQLGLWDLQSGKLLLSFALHGSIQHLWYDGKMLYAASELGTYQTIDLSTFNQPYDEVLTHIQQRIPIKWDSGHAMMASP